MRPKTTLAIVSDIHYASAAEQARGNDYELRGIANPVLRAVVRLYRNFIWQRDPLHQNYLLDRFLAQAQGCQSAIANGDYSCNSAFIGVSDEAACASAKECLDRLRAKFGSHFRATFGDHELGKLSFFGGQGGMRLASWHQARSTLGLEPLWRLELGRYVLLGVVSSLIALPVFEPDTLPAERSEWERLREEHLAQLEWARTPKGLPSSALNPAQRNLLDLVLEQYLGRMPDEVADRVRERLSGFEQDLHFAWAGSLTVNKAHYYRIEGPRLLVEYDNFHRSGKHIHSVWRDPEDDFGEDMLAQHIAHDH